LLWLRWVLANLLGGAVAYLFSTFLSAMMGGIDLLMAALTSVFIGVAQWQVVRDYVPGTRLLGWVVLTTLGFGFGLPVFQGVGQVMARAANRVATWEHASSIYGPVPAALGLMDEFAFPTAILAAAAAGALTGLIMGGLQSLSLRMRLPGAGLWVPASAAGGALGILAGMWVALLAGGNLIGVKPGPANALVIGVFFSPWGIFIISSVVTGVALVLLIRHRTLDASSR